MPKPRRLPYKAKRGVEEASEYLNAVIHLARATRDAAYEADDLLTMNIAIDLLDRLQHAARILDAVLANPELLDDLLAGTPPDYRAR